MTKKLFKTGYIGYIALVFCILFFSHPALSFQFSSNFPVCIQTDDQTLPYSVIDDRQNLYTVWQDKREGEWAIYLAKSNIVTGDVEWEKRITEPGSFAEELNPSVCFGENDHLYVFWQGITGGQSRLYFAKSTDSGLTFSAFREINAGNTRDQHVPRVLCDKNGTIHLVWAEKVNDHFDIYHSKSFDHGDTFLQPTQLNDDTTSADKYYPNIASFENSLYVVWRDRRNGDDDIYFARSDDSGNSFAGNLKVNDDTGIEQTYPTISVDQNNNIFVAWCDKREENYNVYFSRMLYDQSVFDADVRINQAGGSKSYQIKPSMVVDLKGRIYVAWRGDSLGKDIDGFTDVYLTRSNDGGLIFESELILNDDVHSSGYKLDPVVTVDPVGNIVATWADNRNGHHDIFFSTLERADLTVTNNVISFDPASPVYEKPVKISATITNAGSVNAWGFVVRFFKGDPENGGLQIGSDVAVEGLAAQASQEVSVQWQTDLVGIQPISIFIDALDQVEELVEHDNLIQQELGIRLAEWNQFKGMVEAGGTGAGSPFTSWDNYAYTALGAGDRVYVSSADMVNKLAVYDYTSDEWFIYDLDRLYTRGETCELTHQGLQNHLDHMVKISLRYNQTEKNFHIIKQCGNGGIIEGGNDAGGSSFSSFYSSHYLVLNPGNRVFVSSSGAANRISVYNQSTGSWEDIPLDPILGTGQLREITNLLQPYLGNLISIKLYGGTTAHSFHLLKMQNNGGMVSAGTADAGSSFYSFGNSLYTIILDGDNILCSPSRSANKVEVYDYFDSLSTVYDLDRAYTAYELLDISAFADSHANHYVRIQLKEDSTNRTFHMLKRGTAGGLVEGAYNDASSSFGSFSADKYTLLLPGDSLLAAFNGHVDRIKVYDFYESSWFEYILLGGVEAYTVFDFTPYLADHAGHFVQLQFYDGETQRHSHLLKGNSTGGIGDKVAPVLSEQSMEPANGSWQDIFTYGLNVSDADGDRVRVSLQVKGLSTWQTVGTAEVVGSGALSWEHRFSVTDIGMTTRYRFYYNDGTHSGLYPDVDGFPGPAIAEGNWRPGISEGSLAFSSWYSYAFTVVQPGDSVRVMATESVSEVGIYDYTKGEWFYYPMVTSAPAYHEVEITEYGFADHHGHRIQIVLRDGGTNRNFRLVKENTMGGWIEGAGSGSFKSWSGTDLYTILRQGDRLYLTASNVIDRIEVLDYRTDETHTIFLGHLQPSYEQLEITPFLEDYIGGLIRIRALQGTSARNFRLLKKNTQGGMVECADAGGASPFYSWGTQLYTTVFYKDRFFVAADNSFDSIKVYDYVDGAEYYHNLGSTYGRGEVAEITSELAGYAGHLIRLDVTLGATVRNFHLVKESLSGALVEGGSSSGSFASWASEYRSQYSPGDRFLFTPTDTIDRIQAYNTVTGQWETILLGGNVFGAYTTTDLTSYLSGYEGKYLYLRVYYMGTQRSFHLTRISGNEPVPGKHAPVLSNEEVMPEAGRWDEPFTFALDVSDADNDSVTVSLEVYSRDRWEFYGSRQSTSGSLETLSWEQSFSPLDCGQTLWYRFHFSDGLHHGYYPDINGAQGPDINMDSPILGMVENGYGGAGSSFSSWSTTHYTVLRAGERLYLASPDSIGHLEIYDYSDDETYTYVLDVSMGEVANIPEDLLSLHEGHLIRIYAFNGSTQKSFHLVKKTFKGGFVEGEGLGNSSSFLSWSPTHYTFIQEGDRLYIVPDQPVESLKIYNYEIGQEEEIALPEVINTGVMTEVGVYLADYQDRFIRLEAYQGTTGRNFHLLKETAHGGLVEGVGSGYGSSFYSFHTSLYTFVMSGDDLYVSSDSTFDRFQAHDYTTGEWRVFDFERSYSGGEIACLTRIERFYDNAGNPGMEPHLTQGTDFTDWGTEPETSVVRDNDAVIFTYTGLYADSAYDLAVTYFEGDSAGRVQTITVDGELIAGDTMVTGSPVVHRYELPAGLYADSEIVVRFEESGDHDAVVAEITIEERPLADLSNRMLQIQVLSGATARNFHMVKQNSGGGLVEGGHPGSYQNGSFGSWYRGEKHLLYQDGDRVLVAATDVFDTLQLYDYATDKQETIDLDNLYSAYEVQDITRFLNGHEGHLIHVQVLYQESARSFHMAKLAPAASAMNASPALSEAVLLSGSGNWNEDYTYQVKVSDAEGDPVTVFLEVFTNGQWQKVAGQEVTPEGEETLTFTYQFTLIDQNQTARYRFCYHDPFNEGFYPDAAGLEGPELALSGYGFGLVEAGGRSGYAAGGGSSFSSWTTQAYLILEAGDRLIVTADYSVNRVKIYDFVDDTEYLYDLDRLYDRGEAIELPVNDYSLHWGHFVRLRLADRNNPETNRNLHLVQYPASGGLLEGSGSAQGSFYAWDNDKYLIHNTGDQLFVAASDKIERISVYDYTQNTWEDHELGTVVLKGERIEITPLLDTCAGKFIRLQVKWETTARPFYLVKKNQQGGIVAGGDCGGGSSFYSWYTDLYSIFLPGDNLYAAVQSGADELRIYDYVQGQWSVYSLDRHYSQGEVIDLSSYTGNHLQRLVQIRLYDGGTSRNFHLVKRTDGGGMVEGGYFYQNSSFGIYANEMYLIVGSNERVLMSPGSFVDRLMVYDYTTDEEQEVDLSSVIPQYGLRDITAYLSGFEGRFIRLRAYYGAGRQNYHLLKVSLTEPFLNESPLVSEPGVDHTTGTWEEPFVFSVRVSDADGDDVEATLQLFLDNRWMNAGTQRVEGGADTVLTWEHFFGYQDRGETPVYRFLIDDGYHQTYIPNVDGVEEINIEMAGTSVDGDIVGIVETGSTGDPFGHWANVAYTTIKSDDELYLFAIESVDEIKVYDYYYASEYSYNLPKIYAKGEQITLVADQLADHVGHFVRIQLYFNSTAKNFHMAKKTQKGGYVEGGITGSVGTPFSDCSLEKSLFYLSDDRIYMTPDDYVDTLEVYSYRDDTYEEFDLTNIVPRDDASLMTMSDAVPSTIVTGNIQIDITDYLADYMGSMIRLKVKLGSQYVNFRMIVKNIQGGISEGGSHTNGSAFCDWANEVTTVLFRDDKLYVSASTQYNRIMITDYSDNGRTVIYPLDHIYQSGEIADISSYMENHANHLIKIQMYNGPSTCSFHYRKTLVNGGFIEGGAASLTRWDSTAYTFADSGTQLLIVADNEFNKILINDYFRDEEYIYNFDMIQGGKLFGLGHYLSDHHHCLIEIQVYQNNTRVNFHLIKLFSQAKFDSNYPEDNLLPQFQNTSVDPPVGHMNTQFTYHTEVFNPEDETTLVTLQLLINNIWENADTLECVGETAQQLEWTHQFDAGDSLQLARYRFYYNDSVNTGYYPSLAGLPGPELSEALLYSGIVESGSGGTASSFYHWRPNAYTVIQEGDSLYVAAQSDVNQIGIYDYSQGTWFYYETDRTYGQGETICLNPLGLQNHVSKFIKVNLLLNGTPANFHLKKVNNQGGMVEGGGDGNGSSFSSWAASHTTGILPGNKVYIVPVAEADELIVFDYATEETITYTFETSHDPYDIIDVSTYLENHVNHLVRIKSAFGSSDVQSHMIKKTSRGGVVEGGNSSIAGASFYPLGTGLTAAYMSGDTVHMVSDRQIDAVRIYDFINEVWNDHFLSSPINAGEVVDITDLLDGYINQLVRIQAYDNFVQCNIHLIKETCNGGIVEGGSSSDGSFSGWSSNLYTFLDDSDCFIIFSEDYFNKIVVYDYTTLEHQDIHLDTLREKRFGWDITSYLRPYSGRFIRLQLFRDTTQVSYHGLKIIVNNDSDFDNDGLYDYLENAGCTETFDADTDDDGISDGAEDANKNGVVDPGETDPCSIDTDGDGIQDGTELGITAPVPDPDGDGPLLGTDTSRFIPDKDPTTKTDPLDEDSDDDGVSDGVEDTNHNGAINTGETDPSNPSSYPAQTTIHLKKGFNLIAIPADVTGQPDLRDWLPAFGDSSEIEKVMAYDKANSRFITLIPEDGSNPSFTLEVGEGLIVYAKQEKEITFTSVLCSTHDLKPGFNLIGFACPPDGYTAFQLLSVLGSENVSSIQRYSTEKGAFETAGLGPEGQLVGIDFPIVSGEGYFVYMKQ